MKIVKLTAENLKRLRAVEITPDGNTVVIAGRNGAGKTSVLDAIWFALGGGNAMRDTARPIRDGADEAIVTLDLGDLLVTRTWVGDKTTLRVESADGARYNSPQAMLDRLVGKMSFDPLAFAQQDEKSQLATLLSLVDLPFDPAELDGKRRALYEDRTVIGREVKALEGQFAGLAQPADDVPADEISAAEILAEFRDAQHVASQRVQAEQDVREAQGAVERAQELLTRAQARLASAQQNAALNTPAPDLSLYDSRLADIETVNQRVRAAAEYRRLAQLLDDRRTEYAEKTDAITALDAQKSKAIHDAKMPIPGLAFDDDGVTYNGIPFKQCSAAEQLRVSLAMAMAMNPQIRVIRITDGSLLDSDNLRLIEQMAADRDFQVWIERVDETGAMGVLIEDGQVVAAPVQVGAAS